MPISYHLGLWAALFMVVASVIKIVVSRHVGNTALSKFMRWECVSIIIYWLLCFISMLYTSDVEEGWSSMRIKSSLLILPLCVLLCDTSYLKAKHLRGVGYAIVCAVTVVFFYLLGKALLNVSEGMNVVAAFSSQFDTRHHSYVAIYIVMSLLFVVYELKNNRSSIPQWLVVAMSIYSAIGVLYIEIVNSRAGLLGLYLLLGAVIAFMVFEKRKWWSIVLLALFIGGYTFTLEKTLPGHTNRITQTIENVAKDNTSDARIKINHSSVELSKSSFFFGYGVGDYQDLLQQQYATDNYFPTSHFNAHNQYMECILAIGFVGCIPVLFFLLTPVVYVLRKKLKIWPYILVATIVVLLNLLFESMLERLMGVLFITLIYTFMILVISCQENIFVGNKKKDVPLQRF